MGNGAPTGAPGDGSGDSPWGREGPQSPLGVKAGVPGVGGPGRRGPLTHPPCSPLSSAGAAGGGRRRQRENAEDHRLRPRPRVAAHDEDERGRHLRLDGARGHQGVHLLQGQRCLEVPRLEGGGGSRGVPWGGWGPLSPGGPRHLGLGGVVEGAWMSWTPWGGVGTPTPESWGSQTFGSLGGGSGRPLDACVHGGGGGGG